MSRLEAVLDELRSVVDSLDPAVWTGVQARRAVEAFVAIERVAVAGRILALGRLDETGAWTVGNHHRDVASWLAAEAGIAVGAAHGVVETARRVRDLPETAAAVRSGRLSGAQTDVIARAAVEAPHAEAGLLEQAAHDGLRGLREEAGRVRAAARRDDAERDEKNHRERRLVHVPRCDGTGRIEIHGPLDRTARIMASLEAHERQIFAANRASGRAEHPDAAAFDALVQLCSDVPAPGAVKGRRPLTTMVVHVSAAAVARGHTEPGEICEIAGAGPTSVGTARRLMSDCFLEIVERDGVDVTRVAHYGRTITAHQRTAIEVQDPVCVIAGCEVAHHLEIDHNEPFATGGLTTTRDCRRMCRHHHDLKTRHDLRRAGPPGRQRLVTKEEYERITRGGDP